ncbi:hypothetical protein HMPREF1221_01458 [Treponema socranskii subsp. paredis ATCC 35535]|nr:hypothetical protein HMPREF1221_01458 [Treponema socranskii subsp. paredis ATCC 35535]
MFPDCSGSNYVSFVPAYSFALAYFSSGDLYVSACVLLSFLPFACQTAHLRFSRVACNLPLFLLACQVLPPAFFNIFSSPPLRPPCPPVLATAPECGLKIQRAHTGHTRTDNERSPDCAGYSTNLLLIICLIFLPKYRKHKTRKRDRERKLYRADKKLPPKKRSKVSFFQSQNRSFN